MPKLDGKEVSDAELQEWLRKPTPERPAVPKPQPPWISDMLNQPSKKPEPTTAESEC
jgi:hypothetical protein